MTNSENLARSVGETPVFELLMDEALREHACRAVEKFLAEYRPVKNVQLHAIPNIIRAAGMSGLRTLIENQKNKNTRTENKEFWTFLYELILVHPGPEHSLRAFIVEHTELNLPFDDENRTSDKKEQKLIRKGNKKIMEEVLEMVLDMYFEHFNSHYFYMTGGA